MADGKKLKRSYSILNAASDRGVYKIAVQREANGRGGSSFIHEHVRVGDVIEFDGPRNYFQVDPEGTDNILIAGGIGITPVLCMARDMQARNIKYHLHFAARQPGLMPLKEEVEQDCASLSLWFDDGVVGTGLNLESAIDQWLPGKHVYVCGPAGLISAVQKTCANRGWPDKNVHFESFSTVQDEQFPLTVELSRSGRTLNVAPDQTILEALLAADIAVDYDCGIGECGSCVTKVLEGVPIHKDVCLSMRDKEDGDFCTCVSWARTSKLVLDL
jgi:vanillate O-demethylase ferredoxin subunit